MVKFGLVLFSFICFDLVSSGLVILVDCMAFWMKTSQVTSNQKCYQVPKPENKKCMWHFSLDSYEMK